MTRLQEMRKRRAAGMSKAKLAAGGVIGDKERARLEVLARGRRTQARLRPAAKITAATINRELARRGIAERLRQGRGYVYFTDGDAMCWYSSSIPVCYVADLVEPTLEATMAVVLRERDSLAGLRGRF